MNKIYSFAICLLFSFGPLFGQKIDYDNSSKWFLGLNAGATWQTTDVANKFNYGYGLTLGKSFNYNYGKKISFDIRARYLRGFWYGQDYDSTSLATYNPTSQTTGFPLQTYKDSLGFAVNNFQTDVHRLALELVLHANGIRERSGWDPYIFGGVGFTWYQTNGDLKPNDASSTFYDYTNNLNKPAINALTDGIYDSPLVGTTANKYSVGFMPSLGFGIGYQVGKRTTIGLEHKTTFTLIDNFDGYIDPSSKHNDIYHYTSMYINFRFKTRGTTTTGGNSVNNVDNYNQNTGNPPCVVPTILFINPATNALITNSLNYQVSAEIKEIGGKENITFKVNGISNLNFTYNPTTHRLESSVILNPGINTFEIAVNNACGSDLETTTVNYQNCVAPNITMVAPTTSGTTVSNASFTLSAMVQHSNNGQGISVNQNGRAITNFSFNNVSGALTSSLTLLPGLNTFIITATNDCGTDTETITVNYQNCVAPVITMVAPTANGTTVSNAAFTLSTLIQHSNNGQGITLNQNGRAITNFSFNNASGVLTSSLTLLPGLNTFIITATNDCGTDTETITVNYQNCVAPVITMVAPTANGTTVSNAAFTLSTLIQHSNNGQGITLNQNGRAITNFSFNNVSGALTSSLTLLPGLNTFIITVTNDCGTDTETITINYQNCVAPVITMVMPTANGTTVTSANYTLSALIQNSNNGQGITLNQNNTNSTNFSFNNATGAFSSSVTLVPGLNTFVIASANTCGTDIESITINYNNCIAPSVSITSPATNGTTVTAASYTFNAMVLNSVNGQGISLSQNGVAITNYNFNNATGALSKAITLSPGLNTFVLSVINGCGNDTKTITINYNDCLPPVILITSPANGSTVTIGGTEIDATIQNVSNSQGIVFTQNGSPITGFTFSGAGSFVGKVNLLSGLNTFVITATNGCGTTTQTITVTYNSCIPPSVSITSPAANGTTVTTASYTFNATVLNSTNGQGISLSQNGVAITNYNFNNATGALSKAITLSPGLNTFVLSVTNGCGNDTKTIIINYNDCVPPVILFVAPAISGTTVTSALFKLSATIQNSSNGQGIALDQNGRAITNFNINSTTGEFISSLTLLPGLNTFTLTTTNGCGTTSETITINYNNCVPPVILITSPANGSTVTIGGTEIDATIQNVSNSQGIVFTQNGSPITGFTFSGAGSFVGKVNLLAGLNTFVITATNGCGTATETITVTYNNCTPPTVGMINPATNGTTVTTANYSFSASVLNSINGQGISLSQNGGPISNFNINAATGVVSKDVTLALGLNTFVVGVTNSCGSDNETITILYVPEVIEEKIIICHIPPGNSGNPQTIEIPLSAWPAHQAHGDNLGACPDNNAGGSNDASGGGKEDAVDQNQKIIICHIPPGNNGNPQTIEIPLSAWPAHQAHGDNLGPCTDNNDNGNAGSSNGNNGSGGANENNGSGVSEGNGNGNNGSSENNGSGASEGNGNGNNGSSENNGSGESGENGNGSGENENGNNGGGNKAPTTEKKVGSGTIKPKVEMPIKPTEGTSEKKEEKPLEVKPKTTPGKGGN